MLYAAPLVIKYIYVIIIYVSIGSVVYTSLLN